MKIFEARYNHCIHESSMGTISIHKTKEGAIKAMKAHKAIERKKWNEFDKRNRKKFDKEFLEKEYRKYYSFGKHEHWDIIETEVFE